jgi:hypothetical protein
VEAKDEQDACNAAFEKTDVCTYMKELYEYTGSKWEKMTTCKNLTVYDGPDDKIETNDMLCTKSSGDKVYRAFDGTSYDSYNEGSKAYDDKWYSVTDYCATKQKYCNNEADSECEFVQPYAERELYTCNKQTGKWERVVEDE